MATSEDLEELLIRWQELRGRVPPPSVAEICAEHPSLAPELARRIAAFESMEAALGMRAGATIPESVIKPGVPNNLAEKLRPLGYELVEEIDQGGMGVVYKAIQIQLRRLVALKMIAGVRVGPKQLRRFQVEAEAVAQLHHPNIVQIYEVGSVDGHSFFSMEYVDGGNLARRLWDGPLSPLAAAELLETIARAVHHAHTRGIIHRDLKPANILMGKDERQHLQVEASQAADGVSGATARLQPASSHPKITDFGLAKQLGADSDHTATGEVLGTPSYMAPEQAEGRISEIGTATDVYSLGAILYESMTGKPPFRGSSLLDTLRKVVSEEPESPRRHSPSVPRDLEAICLKCLEKNPARRYASADALAEDLRRFQAGLPVTARPLTYFGRCAKWVRRRPVWAGVLLILALTPGVVQAWRYVLRERERQRVIQRALEVAPEAQEILHHHCYECHGQLRVERKLHVFDRSSMFEPTRKNVVPGAPDHSRLIQRIEDGSMPPDDEHLPRVSEQELAILKDWIAGGAPEFPPLESLRPRPQDAATELAGEVKTIFIRYCYECHQAKKADGGVKILHHDALLKPQRGIVIPGRPDDSELYQRMASEEEGFVMPPRSPQPPPTPAEIEKVKQWIVAGAPPFPRTVAPRK